MKKSARYVAPYHWTPLAVGFFFIVYLLLIVYEQHTTGHGLI